MKFRFAAVAAAASFVFAAGSASAAVTLTNLDGNFVGFSEFDWSAAGQAWISGYDITSASAPGTVDQFRLRYQASAVGIKINGVDVPGVQLPGLNSTYEYTIFVDVQETASCITFVGCTAAQLDLVGGTWSVYYDTNAATFANYSAGTGFTDGVLLLSGTFTSASPVIAPQGPTNPGNASVAPSLFGQVMTTNLTYINPTLNLTQASSTLQFGNTKQANWIAPTSMNGAAVGATSNTNFTAQADANQSFAVAVPEPGSLALAGLALGAAGFIARRRNLK